MSTPLPPFKRAVNGQAVVCNGILTDFEILKQASTMIDYFAICRQTSQLFVQFSNGACFLYNNVPVETLEAATQAESIGKFFHAQVRNKYSDTPLENNCIKIAAPATNDFENLDERGDAPDDFDEIGSTAHGLDLFDDDDEDDDRY